MKNHRNRPSKQKDSRIDVFNKNSKSMQLVIYMLNAGTNWCLKHKSGQEQMSTLIEKHTNMKPNNNKVNKNNENDNNRIYNMVKYRKRRVILISKKV